MIQRWKAWTHKWGEILLQRFDAWFTSGKGVYQTLFVCLVICVVEVVWPQLDPHYFYLLAILTVYSAVTQPALAQAGAVTSEEIRALTKQLHELTEAIFVEVSEEGEILEDVHDLLKLAQKKDA